MKIALVILGASGAGKDTLLSALLDLSPIYKKVSFSRPLKSYLEEAYSLEPFYLDTPEGKATPFPPAPNNTFLDVLMEAYHCSKEGVLGHMVTDLALKNILSDYKPVAVFTDMRKLMEAQHLVKLGLPIYLVNLSSHLEVVRSTDETMEDIARFLIDSGPINPYSYHNDYEVNPSGLSTFAGQLHKNILRRLEDILWRIGE